MLFSGKHLSNTYTRADTPERLSKLGFIHQMTLERSFDLLRESAPASALLIQNVLASDHLKLHQSHNADTTESQRPIFFRVEIAPEEIVKILGLLTQLGSELVTRAGATTDERQSLRQIIRDWTHIGDWIIQRSLACPLPSQP